MPGNLSTRETVQAKWCAAIALVSLGIFVVLCGCYVWLSYFGRHNPNVAAGITAALGSGAGQFYLHPWQKNALLSGIFLSVLISAVPTLFFRLAYRQWPTPPAIYGRVLSFLFVLLALYIVASSIGWV